MIRSTLASLAMAAAAAGLVGCSANSGGGHVTEMGPTQLAAFSARAQYPETPATESQRTAAIVNKNEIKIYNFSTQPVSDAKVWVNHSFVLHIPGIAPQSKVVLKTSQLYDSMGNSLADQKADVSSVQLQTGNGFYTVQGPVTD